MRLRRPKLDHAPEIHAAIVQDHQSNPLLLAQTLQSLGWELADAAWATVHWPLEWLAAAVAFEKQQRGIKLHTFSDDALAALRVELAAKQVTTGQVKPHATPRISHAPTKRKHKSLFLDELTGRESR